jgi:hypothetical protein
LKNPLHGNTKHGQARKGKQTSVWKSWSSMLRRCFNPDDAHFKRYAERGITVCPQWRSFEAFFADMGECPPGLTLERENNDLGYFKENCKWATRKEQANNRSSNHLIEYKGIKMTCAQWADELGVKYATLRKRALQNRPLDQKLYQRTGHCIANS